jgi:hypothetical protein
MVQESSRGRFGDLLAIMLAGITWRLISSRKCKSLTIFPHRMNTKLTNLNFYFDVILNLSFLLSWIDLWNIYLHNFTCLCLLRSFKALPHSEFEVFIMNTDREVEKLTFAL